MSELGVPPPRLQPVTISCERVEQDAQLGLAIACEPPLHNTAEEQAVLDHISLRRGTGMARQIRAGGKDYFPIIWERPGARYVESSVNRGVEPVNLAMEAIANLLGHHDTTVIPFEG